MIRKALDAMADQTDSILRQFVMLTLANLGEQLQMLADGTIVFSDAQAWQTIYDQFLRSPDITKHWSVAWVRSADYWQDEAGQQSIAANFAAVRRGLMIHRLVIIADPTLRASIHYPVMLAAPIKVPTEVGLALIALRPTDRGPRPPSPPNQVLSGQNAYLRPNISEIY